MAMLDYVKDKMEVAQAIMTFIQNTPNITDDFLERNYTMIMRSALVNGEQQMASDAQERLEKIASIAKFNSAKEKADQAAAEDILNTI